MSTHVPRPPKTEGSAVRAAGADAAPIETTAAPSAPQRAIRSTRSLYGRLMRTMSRPGENRSDADAAQLVEQWLPKPLGASRRSTTIGPDPRRMQGFCRILHTSVRTARRHGRGRRFPLAARRVRGDSRETGARAMNDQTDSRSAVAAACRRSLTSANSRAARSMRSCCICARSCWWSTRSCWLSARACWRSARSVIALRSVAIASTLWVSSANWEATLAMSSSVVTVFWILRLGPYAASAPKWR